MRNYDEEFEQWGTARVLRYPGPQGADPNFRGGSYRGERIRMGEGQANYGRYREWLAHSLEGYPMPERRVIGYDRSIRGGRDARPAGRYDRELREGGGVRADAGYLRDFNENSPALRGGREQGRRLGYADDSPDPRRWRTGGGRSYDREHNRLGGQSSAGFAENWLPDQAPRGTSMRHGPGRNQ